jgi:hypothetical protein
MTLIAYFFSSTWSYSAPTPLNIVVPSVNSSASVIANSATFAIGTSGQPITITDDPCPRYIVNDSGTIITASAQCSTWGADVLTPLYIHLSVGDSLGVSWTDIFTSSPGLTIPGGSTAVTTVTPDAVQISKSDQIKVIIFPGSNTTCQNVTVTVGWSNV